MRDGRVLPSPAVRYELAIACAATLCAATMAYAQSSIPRAGSLPSAPRQHFRALPARGGMVVGIDPETGRLVMPEPEAMARLIASREAGVRTARPAPVSHADGTVSLDVRTWMREYLRMGRTVDGQLVVRCVSGREAAARAAHEAPLPAQEER